MRRALLLLLALPAIADTSLPSPPPTAWAGRCVEALRRAQAKLSTSEPSFAAGEIIIGERSVRFDAHVPDAEHGRFFDGKPAHFFVEVKEKKSDAPGELGGSVGTATSSQASAGFSRWTRTRFADLGAQIAEGRRVFRFEKQFRPAIAECLR